MKDEEKRQDERCGSIRMARDHVWEATGGTAGESPAGNRAGQRSVGVLAWKKEGDC